MTGAQAALLFLTTIEVAEILRISRRTLERMREHLKTSYAALGEQNTRLLALDRLNTGPFVRFLDGYQPDVAICTHFLPSEIISWLKRQEKVRIMNAVVVTDFDVHAMWLCRQAEQYFVPLEETKAHLMALGVPESLVTISGIPTGSLGPGTGDLHRQVVHLNGLIIAGLEGSMAYNHGPHQYSELGMRYQISRIVPRLLLNKLRYGRYLDILITHAPPRGIHDRPDRCHTGFEAFRRFIRRFRPRYHLHGHIHVYDRQTTVRTQVDDTIVQNVYGYKELRIPPFAGDRTVAK